MTEQSEAPPWEQAKSHSQLWLDRAKAGSREEQNALAPQEHKAFAKELVSDKPWMAPSLAVAIPAYQVQKVLTGGSRSDPSLKQVTEAYKGIGEGLADAVSKPWEIAKEWAKKLLQGDSQPGPTNPTNSRKKQPTEAPSGSGLDIKRFTDKLIKIESGGAASAKNPNSSATGLHQFTAGTWRDTTRAMGVNYNLTDRTDPVKSAEVFQFFTAKNLQKAEKDLGRTPEEHELYMYHLLGRNGASDILQASGEASAKDFAGAGQVKANKSLFFDKEGQPLKVKSFMQKIKDKFNSK